MKVFSTTVAIYATLYVLAETEEEAEAMARETVQDAGLEFSSRRQYVGDGIEMTGETFNADMPEISLSPAMSFAPMEEQQFSMELSDDLDETDEDEEGEDEEDGE